MSSTHAKKCSVEILGWKLVYYSVLANILNELCLIVCTRAWAKGVMQLFALQNGG